MPVALLPDADDPYHRGDVAADILRRIDASPLSGRLRAAALKIAWTDCGWIS